MEIASESAFPQLPPVHSLLACLLYTGGDTWADAVTQMILPISDYLQQTRPLGIEI